MKSILDYLNIHWCQISKRIHIVASENFVCSDFPVEYSVFQRNHLIKFYVWLSEQMIVMNCRTSLWDVTVTKGLTFSTAISWEGGMFISQASAVPHSEVGYSFKRWSLDPLAAFILLKYPLFYTYVEVVNNVRKELIFLAHLHFEFKDLLWSNLVTIRLNYQCSLKK